MKVNLFFKRSKTSEVIWMMRKLLRKMKTNLKSKRMKRKVIGRKLIQVRGLKFLKSLFHRRNRTNQVGHRPWIIAKLEIYEPSKVKRFKKKIKKQRKMVELDLKIFGITSKPRTRFLCFSFGLFWSLDPYHSLSFPIYNTQKLVTLLKEKISK